MQAVLQGNLNPSAMRANRTAQPDGTFRIECVQTNEQRGAASRLLSRCYGAKGYSTVGAPEGAVSVVSFLAVDQQKDTEIGTLSVRFGKKSALSAERIFPAEILAIRDRGGIPCEMTRFAVDHNARSKQMILALFDAAFVHAYYIENATDLLIEVNPSHCRFYQRQLHFEIAGDERYNPWINAPSVLLRQDMEYGARMAYRGEWRRNPAAERSLLRCVAGAMGAATQ